MMMGFNTSLAGRGAVVRARTLDDHPEPQGPVNGAAGLVLTRLPVLLPLGLAGQLQLRGNRGGALRHRLFAGRALGDTTFLQARRGRGESEQGSSRLFLGDCSRRKRVQTSHPALAGTESHPPPCRKASHTSEELVPLGVAIVTQFEDTHPSNLDVGVLDALAHLLLERVEDRLHRHVEHPHRRATRDLRKILRHTANECVRVAGRPATGHQLATVTCFLLCATRRRMACIRAGSSVADFRSMYCAPKMPW